MAISADELSVLVFRRTPTHDLGEFSLDSNMLSLLMELDGEKSLGAVAQKIGLDLSTMKAVITKLYRLKLVVPVKSAISLVDREFLTYLRKELTLAIGPLADVLIEDAIGDMGYQENKFPSHRAAELVELLARDITRDEKKTLFKMNMVKVLKQKGY
jgi:hypothetical protein